MSPFARKFPVLLAACLLASALWPPGAPARLLAVRVYEENDLFFGQDRSYTEGLRMGLDYSSRQWWPRSIPFMTRADTVGGRSAVTTSTGFVLGQSTYTPRDLGRSELITGDRPYAGWLYAGTVLRVATPSRMRALELDLGIVGPASLAGALQRWYHRMAGLPRPNGWEHQLRNEPGLVLSYQEVTRLAAAGGERRWFDLGGNYGAAVGNVHDYVNAGAGARLGFHLSDETAPTRIGPSVSFHRFEDAPALPAWEAFAFAAAGARYVARNLFLDGSTFTDSHHVPRTPWVADLDVGLAVRHRSLSTEVHAVFWTREFEGGYPHRYVSISTTYRP